ncbi:MAG: hypothetical protein MMC33_002324 [Icmadophila ericetorum]|nr:hypothetical protein [Icmadophila ericetorum]
MASSSSTIFSLEGKSLRLNTAADAASHLEPLRSSDAFTEIRLQGNTLGVEASQEIASLLKSQKSLQVANLGDIFTSRLVDEIPSALSALLTSLLELPELHTVDLSDNAFGLMTVEPLVAFLRAHIPLKHLILNNNGLGPRAGSMIGEALSELADRKEEARRQGKDIPALETIVCGRNRLENGSMDAWAKAFQKHKGVKIVRMVQNGIRQQGITTLLREGLKGCVELEVLDMEDNTFTITGSQALAEAVVGWKSIRNLCLGDCYLSARGGVVVAEALGKGHNTGLQTLKAPYNNWTTKSVQALLAATTKGGLVNLRRLELNGNKFAEEDESVESLRILLDKRKEEHEEKGGDTKENEWGLDELDELDDDDEDSAAEDEEEEAAEEDEDEDGKKETTEAEGEAILKEADAEENENVSQKKDEDVDALADKLGKTEL